MKDEDRIQEQDLRDQEQIADAGQTLAHKPISGLYATHGVIPGLVQASGQMSDSSGTEAAGPSSILPLLGEELRLDVDGRYPQMTASGTIPVSKVQRLHWIAQIAQTGPHTYSGGIWYKEPATTPFGYTAVDIKVTPSLFPGGRKAKVTFSGGGLPKRTRIFHFKSPYFHKVEFEFDAEQPITPGLQIASCAHPNRPATLPCENLTIQRVFQRSGFDASVSTQASSLPAPPGGTWSDMEMHDAMVTFWARFANTAQWAMWVLFANQHEMGTGLGGIMFDDIGSNHRQGTALFYNSFISDAPVGDPNPVAWVDRMRFWTAVHEMGHAFNLAHSWQKALGTPWIPLANEPEARSFMNYPYGVMGGQSTFFADFAFRFSDQELLFMRHAPGQFVRMGDAAWFDHHGFQQASLHAEPPLSLDVRVNRPRALYEFMEPVVVELKIKNISTVPQIVDENMTTTLDGITIALKRQGSPARQFIPYAQYCMKGSPKVLQPGEAIYGSVYITAGLNGVDVAEPGRYVIQAALHRPDGDIVSLPLMLRIAPPRGYEEELIAQDFLTNEVSRVMAFDGTRVITDANNTLREVVDQLGDRRVARHARIPLGLSVAEAAKVLTVAGGMQTTLRSAADLGGAIEALPAKPDEARKELKTALVDNPDVAAESLGHIDYKVYMDEYTDMLVAQGERQEAAAAQDTLYNILGARNVLPSVLEQIDTRRSSLKKAKGA